jgi:hypothetical protein
VGSPRGRRLLVAAAVIAFVIALTWPVLGASGGEAQLSDEPHPAGPPLPSGSTSNDPEAVATDSPQAQAEREASQTAYVDASAPQAQTLMQDTFAQRDSLVAADPMSIPDPGTVEGWIGDRAARIDPPGDEDPYVLTSTYPLRVRDDSGDLRPLDFELVRDGVAYAPANVAEEVSLPAAATGFIELSGNSFAACSPVVRR